ncbi:MAG: glycosyltransferase [Gemmatimonadetes bacterium]|nr:glycosyltransferase [Gemmatimonadota bacterium]
MKVVYVSKASVVAAHRDKLRLLAREVDLEVVLPERWHGPPEALDASHGVRLTTLPVLFPGRNHFHLYRGLGAVIDRFRPDVVHIDEEPYSAVTLQGGVAARRRGLPFIFFAAQNVAKRYPPPFQGLRKWVFRRSAGGIAGTQQAADVIRALGFTGRLAVIPQMGVDPSLFCFDDAARAETRTKLGLDQERLVVAFLGRLVPEKGVDLLLEALRLSPELHAIITGAGPEAESLRAQASDLGIEARVHFTGEVASLEVPALLSAADVLCLPSRSTARGAEQFGRVLVEAMSMGIPVIATECGGMPAVVGDAGLLVPMNAPEALARALRRLAEDPELRAELGRRGRARAEALFSQRRVVDDTVRFYDDVLAGGEA